LRLSLSLGIMAVEERDVEVGGVFDTTLLLILGVIIIVATNYSLGLRY
jgi:hypothetical protein